MGLRTVRKENEPVQTGGLAAPTSLDKAEGWGREHQLVAGKVRVGREGRNQCERKQRPCLVVFIVNVLPPSMFACN